MKKVVATILAILYITASSGVVLNVHYCMGKISSVKVDNFSRDLCKCGKLSEKSDCCKTEFKVVKLNNDHKASITSFNLNLPVTDLPVQVSYSDLFKTSAFIPEKPVANSPPPYSQKIYIKNRVFRI